MWVVVGVVVSGAGCSTTAGSDNADGSTGAGDGTAANAEDTGAVTQTGPSDGTGSDGSSGTGDSGDDAVDTGTDPDDGTTSGTPEDGTGDAGDTMRDPVGPLDCDALCDPYEDCDKGVFLSCQSNCSDIVPPLDAFDAVCGAASAAYFECRFTLSCEEAVAVHNGSLEPDPCGGLLETYTDTCLAVVPETCGGFCDSLLQCLELPADADNVAGCEFECLLYEAHAALDGTAACDAATDDLIDCIATSECEDMQFPVCSAVEAEHLEACSLG